MKIPYRVNVAWVAGFNVSVSITERLSLENVTLVQIATMLAYKYFSTNFTHYFSHSCAMSYYEE